MLAANSYSWLDKVGYYYRDSESGLTATKRSDPTNVLKILINNNKQIAADYKLLKPSYNNYVADMIAGTIFKYQKDSKKVRQIFDFSHDVVMPEVGLDGDGVSEPTGVFEVVRQGDYSKLVSLINNPKRKIKTIAKRSYSAIQGIVARFTL
jgi:hypothetical protein